MPALLPFLLSCSTFEVIVLGGCVTKDFVYGHGVFLTSPPFREWLSVGNMLAAAEPTQQNIFARAEYTGHITLRAVSEAPAMDQRFYPSGVMISALSFGALILCTWLSSLSLPRRDTPKNSGNAHSANSIVTDGSIAMGPEGGKVPSQIFMAPVVATFVRGGALPGARGRCAAPSIHVACAALALLW